MGIPYIHCISLNCAAGHSLRWYSSSVIAGKYTVNLRMIHGFTSTGFTETQYINYCQASHVGNVEEKYISTGDYNRCTARLKSSCPAYDGVSFILQAIVLERLPMIIYQR
ncbi:uncharacterized protein [Montipora capricornis]|uniref:uncharacterized protein isoform X4 n=1 Tax=Montipora capricornis TaxID=246305 RepID=UPI0035F2017A